MAAAAPAGPPAPKPPVSMRAFVLQHSTIQFFIDRPLLFLMAWCRVGSDLKGTHPLYLAPASLGWRKIATSVLRTTLSCLRSPGTVLPQTLREVWHSSRSLRLIFGAAMILEIPTIAWIVYRSFVNQREKEKLAAGLAPPRTVWKNLSTALATQLKNIPVNLLDMLLFKYLWSTTYLTAGSGGEGKGVPTAQGMYAFLKAGCAAEGTMHFLFGGMAENLINKFTARAVAQYIYSVYIEKLKTRVPAKVRAKIPKWTLLVFSESVAIPSMYYPTALVASRYMIGQYTSYESFFHCSMVRLGGDHMKSDYQEGNSATVGGVPQTMESGLARSYEGVFAHSVITAIKVSGTFLMTHLTSRVLGL